MQEKLPATLANQSACKKFQSESSHVIHRLAKMLLFMLVLQVQTGFSQTSTQDFGFDVKSTNSTAGSTTFLPAPTPAGSATTYVKFGTYSAPNIPISLLRTYKWGTTGSYIQAGSSEFNITKISPWVGYAGSTEFYTSFKVHFQVIDSTLGAFPGKWTFYQGAGAAYSNTDSISQTRNRNQVFAQLTFQWFGVYNVLFINNKPIPNPNGTTGIELGQTSINFSKIRYVHFIELMGNNKATDPISYTYHGSLQTIAAHTFDVYIDGRLAGDDLQAWELPANTNINAGTFIGDKANPVNSNVLNLDDAVVYNRIPAVIGVPSVITPSVTAIIGLDYVQGSGPSAASGSFSISGTLLTPAAGNITITPSADIEVYDGTTWRATAFTVAYTGGSISTAAIYKARLKAGLAPNNYNLQSIGISGGHASASISVSGVVSPAGALPSPALTADVTDNSIYNNVDISFTPNSTWLGALQSVQYGPASLSPSQYSIDPAGIITLYAFANGGNAIFKTAQTASLVITATGYNTAVVAQTILPGQHLSIAVTTQPTAPASSGAILATQPAVTVLDQYNNPVQAGFVVTTAIGSGQGASWTLGGTLSATTNAAGIAVFTGLTATNLSDDSSSASLSFILATNAATALSANFKIPGYLVGYEIMRASTLSYNQDFDALPNTGTNTVWADNSTISHWYAQRTGTATTIVANDGTDTEANLYSYGTGAETERALGAITGGANGSVAYGILLKNKSGAPVSVSVNYTGEQWRNGGLNSQIIGFQYKISSTPFTTLNAGSSIGWQSVTTLNFTSPYNNNQPSALVGNSIFSRKVFNKTVLPLPVANDAYIMLKWNQPSSTNENGMAIDEVTVRWEYGSVAISSPSQEAAGNVAANTTGNILGNFQVIGSGAGGTLSQVSVPFGGNYTSTDIAAYKLWYNTSNSFAGATPFGSAVASASTGSGEAIVFTGAADISSTRYFFITADLAATAAQNNTIQVAAMGASNFTFTGGTTITASTTAAGVKTIQQSAVLPVTLVSFTANLASNKTVALQWNVTEQVGIKNYMVERSVDGSSFSPIGSVAANSLSATNYSYTDVNLPVAATVYYRLRIIGVDGTVTYSSIVTVKLVGSNLISIYPNPAKDYVWLQGGEINLIGTDAYVTDIQGRVISKTRISAWPLQVNTASFPDGVYLIRLDDGQNFKVIISKR